MSHQSELIEKDILAYLEQHEKKELLRFLTCGSVDDGKSTLIGRLLYDTKMIYEDQLAAIRRDSIVHGTTGGDFDPALLTDGLRAEREQGITIDVAYRYFSTAKRKFIIADTPGHAQYTRNMATGASTCDLAIILIDARKGLLEQSRRHSFIVSLLGIKHVIVAVNKMDLVGFSQEVYDKICEDYTNFAARLTVDDVHFIPLSALRGDNVVDASSAMPWYTGSTLMHLLENVHIASDRNLVDFRFPVQYVNRPHQDFRGYCGTIASGIVRPGDAVVVLPSRKQSRVRSIVTHDGELSEAYAPLAVTLTLEDEIDISRGDTLVHPGNQSLVGDHFDAVVVWMAEEPMVPGKQYLVKHSAITVPATISTLRYKFDVNTLSRLDSPTLSLNEIGRCEMSLNRNIAYDGYRRSRSTGAFIVIDRMTNVTVAAGMILDGSNVSSSRDVWDSAPVSARLGLTAGQVTDAERAARFGQRPTTLLLTGLTGSGKTTIAYALERRLFDLGRATTVLDGQNLRLGLSKELGFSADERSENMRRAAEVARLMNRSGLLTILAFVAPDADVRARVRAAIGPEQFLIVHLDASLEVCRERDRHGMYLAADRGELPDFPGVSSPYEVPQDADLVLRTDQLSVDESVSAIIELLESRKIIR
ncbi:MAG: sulfate adenylyltransferase subunit CysN [Planctomycetota bacterium]|nr:sulfate adenylyltransferase subunit CysN [Planctomycetota bacterium]